MFNFGSLANTQVASDIKYLKPYTITHNVTYKSYEIKEGTSEKGNNWKCFKITFTSPDGEYTESIFWPHDGDNDRREVDGSNGGKRKLCSSFEVTMAMIAAIGHAFNPEGFVKMQAISSKFKSFDDVINALVKILEQTKGKVSTSMKLIGRNNNGRIYARLPQPLGIVYDESYVDPVNPANNGWRTFPVSIFGDNLMFSAYEQRKKDEFEAAKPTDMSNPTVVGSGPAPAITVDAAPTNEEPIDFDSLL